MKSEDKAISIILVGLALVGAVFFTIIVALDTFTNDERNQLPRCDTVTEVLVGLGDFDNGRWDDYTCIDRDAL